MNHSLGNRISVEEFLLGTSRYPWSLSETKFFSGEKRDGDNG